MYTPLGIYNQAKAGHPEGYFIERHSNIDYRGLLKISNLSWWGFFNTVITASHDISSGQFTGPMILVRVEVDEYAWITSKCILFDCHIMHHAIVAIGAVVNGIEVQPYTIVAGNPATVVSEWDGTKWQRR